MQSSENEVEKLSPLSPEDPVKAKAGVEAIAADATKHELAAAPKYEVMNAVDILNAEVEKPTDVWGGITLSNAITEIIGPSGIGKSRILLNLAVTQALAETQPTHDKDGKPLPEPEFGGLELYKGRVRWLFMGTENSLYRTKYDLSKMTLSSTPEQLKVLGDRLFVTTLQGPGDVDMAMDDDENFNKVKATIAAVEPDIVVFDPWGDICGGSELDDQDVKNTLKKLLSLHEGIKESLQIVIVNHSRMGGEENAKGIGSESANYGKNSKKIYTSARCVWNILFNDPERPEDSEICLYNPKVSNDKMGRFLVVKFNPVTMSYDTVKGVDARAVKADIEVNKMYSKKPSDDVQDRKIERDIARGVNKALSLVTDGAIPKSLFKEQIAGLSGLSRKVSLVEEELAKNHGWVFERQPGPKRLVLCGTPEQVALYLKKHPLVQPELPRRNTTRQQASNTHTHI